MSDEVVRRPQVTAYRETTVATAMAFALLRRPLQCSRPPTSESV